LIPTATLSLEDKNRAIFRYVTFFLGYEMMDKIQEPSGAKCSVELAEPFRTDEKASFPSIVFEGSSCEERWHRKHLKKNVGTVPWFRRFIAILSPQRPEFSPRTMLLGFVVHKMGVGQVFLQALRFSPVRIITTVLLVYSFIYHGRYVIPENDICPKYNT
jgi:hypothetical protein